MVVFGHDHMGHGESDGSRAYIEDVDHYVDDVITHCMKMQVTNRYLQVASDEFKGFPLKIKYYMKKIL